MSEPIYNGPVCDASLSTTKPGSVGSFQITALSTATVIDCSAFKGQEVEITWTPTQSGDTLFLGFFVDAATAAAGFDVSTSSVASGSPAVVPITQMIAKAPRPMERGSIKRTVPPGRGFLLVQPSGGNAGRFTLGAARGA